MLRFTSKPKGIIKTASLCKKIQKKLEEAQSKINEFDAVAENLKSYAKNGYDVSASLDALKNVQKQTCLTAEETVNTKLQDSLDSK